MVPAMDANDRAILEALITAIELIERQPEPAIAGRGGIETNQNIAKRHFCSPCHRRRKMASPFSANRDQESS